MTHEERIEDKIDRLGDAIAMMNAKVDVFNANLQKVIDEVNQIREDNRRRGKRIGDLEQQQAVSLVTFRHDRDALKEHFSQELRNIRGEFNSKVGLLNRIVLGGGGTVVLMVAGAVVMMALGLKP